MFPLNSNLPRRNKILTRTGWQAGFPRRQGPAGIFQKRPALCVQQCCPVSPHLGRTVGALSGVWDKAGSDMLDLFFSSISGDIHSPLFSLNFCASITGKVKNASACGPALLNFRCSPDVQRGGLCNNNRIWATFLCFSLTKSSSFEAMLIHSPSWEGDGWGRTGLLRLLYQCGRTPKTHTQLLWGDFELHF